MTCINGYDDQITVTPKPTASISIIAKSIIGTITKIAKPYTIEPNAILAQDCEALLAEDGQTLLLEVG